MNLYDFLAVHFNCLKCGTTIVVTDDSSNATAQEHSKTCK